ncbi:MAG: hypothetical protein JKY25_10425 [Robiginitomaculum sp.]|nr:hypothetical protein [Robiginitomaculum sp.]
MGKSANIQWYWNAPDFDDKALERQVEAVFDAGTFKKPVWRYRYSVAHRPKFSLSNHARRNLVMDGYSGGHLLNKHAPPALLAQS